MQNRIFLTHIAFVLHSPFTSEYSQHKASCRKGKLKLGAMKSLPLIGWMHVVRSYWMEACDTAWS
jgi:hypothetical protein